jgi:DNA-directed RNA polymerase subunit RPC12/RpoP
MSGGEFDISRVAFCRVCEYPLRGLSKGACPECSTLFDLADPESFIDLSVPTDAELVDAMYSDLPPIECPECSEKRVEPERSLMNLMRYLLIGGRSRTMMRVRLTYRCPACGARFVLLDVPPRAK